MPQMETLRRDLARVNKEIDRFFRYGGVRGTKEKAKILSALFQSKLCILKSIKLLKGFSAFEEDPHCLGCTTDCSERFEPVDYDILIDGFNDCHSKFKEEE